MNVFGEVMFNSCPEALKNLIGLTPLLEGPGEELWTSPSDLLAGKVCLKPPLTSKHLQALTHQGILGNKNFQKIRQNFLKKKTK